MHFHIIIPCFNRPKSLQRLLDSLSNSEPIPGSCIDITFCVDGPFPATEKIIDDFQWTWGVTKKIVQPENLGIRRHMLLSLETGVNHATNIVLEDDLWVSPVLWKFLNINLESIRSGAYHSFALYHQPYYPSNLHLRLDSQDSFQAIQYPCSSGFLIGGKHIREFLDWQQNTPELKTPTFMTSWTDSWKKVYAAYLIEHNLYVLHPPAALVTNFGDIGVHHRHSSRFFQSPLLLSVPPLEVQDNIRCYDPYFNPLASEIKECIPALNGYDFDIDLTGDKPKGEIKTPYLLSIRPCKSPIMSWSDALKPIERNLEFDVGGVEIRFGRTEDFDFSARITHYRYLEGVIAPKWRRILAKYVLKMLYASSSYL